MIASRLRRRVALWICPELAGPDAEAAWPSALRPEWWWNAPVREFLTSAHRTMTIREARTVCLERFGSAPGASSISRFWQRLDALKAGRDPFTQQETAR